MEKFLRANEVAEIIGVSVTTIRRLTMKKAIPCYKFDHAVRYKPDEIEMWVKARKQEVEKKEEVKKSNEKRNIEPDLFGEETGGGV